MIPEEIKSGWVLKEGVRVRKERAVWTGVGEAEESVRGKRGVSRSQRGVCERLWFG